MRQRAALLISCSLLMTLVLQAQDTRTLAFRPDASGAQTFSGTFADNNASLVVQMIGMTADSTLALEASGDPTLDLALQMDSAFDTQIINAASSGQRELASYMFPSDGDYNLSLFTLAGGGAWTLRLSVPALADSDLPAADAPVRPPNQTEQQLSAFQADSVTTVNSVQGTLADALDEVRVPLPDLKRGDTVYAQVSGSVTPILALSNDSLSERYAQDMNPSGTRTASLQFMVEQDGNYLLTLFSPTGGGDYTLRYGINTPELASSALSSETNAASTDRQYFVNRGTSAQRFSGTMTTANVIRVQVQGVRLGDQLYATATARGNADPLLTLKDANGAVLVTDDNGGGGLVAVIRYTGAREEPLTLELTANTGGEYNLTVGINTPTVLDSIGMGEGALYGGNQFSLTRGTTQEFGGQLADGEDVALITLTGVQPGDTLSAFAEGLNSVDPLLLLYSPDFQYVLAEDEDSGGGTAAAFSVTVDQYGDYTLVLLTSGDSGGGYRVVVGTDDPTILSDNAAQTVAAIAAAGFDCTRAASNERPELSGTVRTLESPNVIVHYTLEGYDATTSAYASALSEAVENSLAVQFGSLGWRKPPNDCGLGGDDRLDVYIQDISYMAIGYARPENRVGDNPNTPETERYSAFSFLVIENDMDFLAQADSTYNTSPTDLMRVTAAHEVHHTIQFGYDTNETYYGFYESGAMWIETLVYPQMTDAYLYDALLLNPDLCVGSRDDSDGLRIYAEWVMIDSFTRDLGMASYQQLWEALSVDDNMQGFYKGLERLGTTIETVIRRMAIRNLLLDYAHGERFTTSVRIADAIRGAGTLQSDERGVQQQSVDYVRVVSGVWRFELKTGSNLRLSLVGIDRDSGIATSYDLGTRGTVDTRPYDAAFLIVQNTTRHQRTEDCYFTLYSLMVSDGTGDVLIAPDADGWNAVQYRDTNP